MFERFTEDAIKSIMLAQEEARRLGLSEVGCEVLLLGVIGESTNPAALALQESEIDLNTGRIKVEEKLGRGSNHGIVEIPFTEECKEALQNSWDAARKESVNFIAAEHLYFGIIQNLESSTVEILNSLGLDFEKVDKELSKLIGEKRAHTKKSFAPSDSILSEMDDSKTIDNSSSSSIQLFRRFTEEALKAIMFAQEEARKLKHSYVGTEHILLGILELKKGIAYKCLKQLNVNHKDVTVEILNFVKTGSVPSPIEIPFTPRAKCVLEYSETEANQLNHKKIDVEHLLLGIIKEGEGMGVAIMKILDVDLAELRKALLDQMNQS